MLEKVGPFTAGDRVRASWLQEMLMAVRRIYNISAASPLKVAFTPTGLLLSFAENLVGCKRFEVVSVGASPSPADTTVALCKTIDVNGNLDIVTIPVVVPSGTAVGDKVYAFKPSNGTGITYDSGKLVEWVAFPGGGGGSDSSGVTSPGNPRRCFWARPWVSEVVPGEARQWLYNWAESERGADGWADVGGGLASTDGTGDTDDTRARNSLENGNASSGEQGDGINSANLLGTFDLVPVNGTGGTGTGVVLMWMDVASDGTQYFSFQANNQVDGECPAP